MTLENTCGGVLVVLSPPFVFAVAMDRSDDGVRS